MEKSRFDIISDLFKLSNVISESLKLAESLAGNLPAVAKRIVRIFAGTSDTA